MSSQPDPGPASTGPQNLGMSAAFRAHVASGDTSLCRCWEVRRSDGQRLGFTDHDGPLEFDGLCFRANGGLSARALQQATGLSIDNTEAMGVLSDAAISAADIEAGRYDGAEVFCWLTNWRDVSVRWLQFRGSMGEIRRSGGAFHAELRGLTELLNRPLGRVYQKPCTAVLGDRACGFDLTAPGYRATPVVDQVSEDRVFLWPDLPGFAPDWFTRGRLSVLSGEAAGLWGAIKRDSTGSEGRRISLWQPLRAPVRRGDQLQLTVGCDKRMQTCRLRFNNLVNFQGFPDIPGEDWVMAVPKQGQRNSGGSRR